MSSIANSVMPLIVYVFPLLVCPYAKMLAAKTKSIVTKTKHYRNIKFVLTIDSVEYTKSNLLSSIFIDLFRVGIESKHFVYKKLVFLTSLIFTKCSFKYFWNILRTKCIGRREERSLRQIIIADYCCVVDTFPIAYIIPRLLFLVSRPYPYRNQYLLSFSGHFFFTKKALVLWIIYRNTFSTSIYRFLTLFSLNTFPPEMQQLESFFLRGWEREMLRLWRKWIQEKDLDGRGDN